MNTGYIKRYLVRFKINESIHLRGIPHPLKMYKVGKNIAFELTINKSK